MMQKNSGLLRLDATTHVACHVSVWLQARTRYFAFFRMKCEQRVWKETKHTYRNDPKFSDRYVWANSADPDQTAPTLFAIPFASFGLITLW